DTLVLRRPGDGPRLERFQALVVRRGGEDGFLFLEEFEAVGPDVEKEYRLEDLDDDAVLEVLVAGSDGGRLAAAEPGHRPVRVDLDDRRVAGGPLHGKPDVRLTQLVEDLDLEPDRLALHDPRLARLDDQAFEPRLAHPHHGVSALAARPRLDARLADREGADLASLADLDDFGSRRDPLHSDVRERPPFRVESPRLELPLLSARELQLRRLHLDLRHGGRRLWRGASSQQRHEKDRRNEAHLHATPQTRDLLPSRCAPGHGGDQGRSTTLPKALRSASSRCASRASERGSTRSTTGRSLPSSTRRTMRCRSPLLPMVDPSSSSRR